MLSTFQLHRLSALGVLVLASSAFASVTIDWVRIGDVGNPADSTGYGAVGYEYQISRNEITVGQYTAFLNAVAKNDPYGLYHTSMASYPSTGALITRSGVSGSYSYSVASGRGNLPIVFVNWFDAARFANWLHNGQGEAASEAEARALTEDGAYTLKGAGVGFIYKNEGARVWIPSENEWYKAAYYDPTKDGGGGYWKYGNGADTLAGNTVGVPGSANYFDGDYVGSGTNSRPDGNALTEVGAYGPHSQSYYGLNDMTGNVSEWNDEVIPSPGGQRGLRDGSWFSPAVIIGSSKRLGSAPWGLGSDMTGFRLARVPEPTSALLCALFGLMCVTRRKR